jgi:hypothetical protein
VAGTLTKKCCTATISSLQAETFLGAVSSGRPMRVLREVVRNRCLHNRGVFLDRMSGRLTPCSIRGVCRHRAPIIGVGSETSPRWKMCTSRQPLPADGDRSGEVRQLTIIAIRADALSCCRPDRGWPQPAGVVARTASLAMAIALALKRLAQRRHGTLLETCDGCRGSNCDRGWSTAQSIEHGCCPMRSPFDPSLL